MITVVVTQEDINTGTPSANGSPIAFGVRRRFLGCSHVLVLSSTVRVEYGSVAREFTLPISALNFIYTYNHNAGPSLPFTFQLFEEVARLYIHKGKWRRMHKTRWHTTIKAIADYLNQVNCEVGNEI